MATPPVRSVRDCQKVRPISHSEQTEAYGTSDALLEIANADWMNNTPKYVTFELARVDRMAERAQRRRQGGGHPAQVKGQREHHGQRQPTLVRSLIDWGLLDQLRLYLHPLVLGSGERLFDEAKVRLYSSSGQWGRDACLPAEQATTPTSSAGRHVPEGLLQRESPRERPLRGTCSRPRPPGLDGQGVGRQRHLRCLVHGGRHRGNQDGEGFLQARRPRLRHKNRGAGRGRLYFSRRRLPSSTPQGDPTIALSARYSALAFSVSARISARFLGFLFFLGP